MFCVHRRYFSPELPGLAGSLKTRDDPGGWPIPSSVAAQPPASARSSVRPGGSSSSAPRRARRGVTVLGSFLTRPGPPGSGWLSVLNKILHKGAAGVDQRKGQSPAAGVSESTAFVLRAGRSLRRSRPAALGHSLAAGGHLGCFSLGRARRCPRPLGRRLVSQGAFLPRASVAWME